MTKQYVTMQTSSDDAPRQPVVLSPQGLYRWEELKPLVPFSRSTWYRQVKAGEAPAPAYCKSSMTAWRGADVLDWLNDPEAYKARAAGA